jgi:serine phosphatase RsbU (regulator of sigma subunit)
MRGGAPQAWLSLTTDLAAALEPADVIEVTADACRSLLGATTVVVAIRESGVSGTAGPAGRRVPGPRSVDDVGPRARWRPAGDDLHPGLLELPLESGTEPLGVLRLGWAAGSEVDDELVATAESVAAVCGSALRRAFAGREEARARRSAESAASWLRTLQAVAGELAHSTDIDHAATIVLRAVIDQLGADAAVLHLLDEDAAVCTRSVSFGDDFSRWTTFRVSDSRLASELMRTGLPVVVHDFADMKERFPDLAERGVRQQAWATVLVATAGRPAGIASFGWSEPRDFDLDEVGVLQALADHLAAAMERARLISSNAALLSEQARIAGALQRSLLPPPLPSWPGVTLAAGYEPAELGTEVCGDFYDAFHAHDGALVVVIGDVTGHGVEAAGLTGMARHTLRALARDLPPAESLRRLNEVLVESVRAPGEDRLLTAAILRLTRHDDGVEAHVALSGHCLPVLVRDGEAQHVGEPGMLLGAFPDSIVGEQVVRLGHGDVLLMHTDGVIEARRNGMEFGEERLLRLLSALDRPGPADVVDRVLGTIRWFRTTAPDDVAVVALQVT